MSKCYRSLVRRRKFLKLTVENGNQYDCRKNTYKKHDTDQGHMRAATSVDEAIETQPAAWGIIGGFRFFDAAIKSMTVLGAHEDLNKFTISDTFYWGFAC